jgi:gamma-glutamyltranspeptidase/glutathione hydrolase
MRDLWSYSQVRQGWSNSRTPALLGRSPFVSFISSALTTMADWYKAPLADASTSDESNSNNKLSFTSRRSPLLCRHACVASSQPLASSIGYDLLKQGANAAEAAIGVAAALAVTEPCSTGLGGDMFCLYYEANSRNVHAVNGSGRSGSRLTWAYLNEKYPSKGGEETIDRIAFRDSPDAVTVPGAAQGWQDLLERHGSGNWTLAQLLEPAAVLAQDGFPVAPITSYHWKSVMSQIRKWLDEGEDVPLSVDGRGPEPGEIIKNPHMARVLRDLGRLGAKEGFYQGATGQAIVDALDKHGGSLTMEDLAAHSSTFPEPIYTEYRDCKLWQIPPNGQGIAGLIALSGLQHLEDKQVIPPITPASLMSADTYHAQLEMMRLGFADTTAHVGDVGSMTAEIKWLLDKDRIGQRAERFFSPTRAQIHGQPGVSNGTVSFQVVDAEGNAISFVNSNFMGFGTGIVPQGCGFTLQNRGFGFTLKKSHPNEPGPRKRPFHTIIPGMLTHADTDELYATISNMGGNMQPQGHLQLTVAMLAGGLDPQAAIDAPRFCINDGSQGGIAHMEEGFDKALVADLLSRGHPLKTNINGHARSTFGRAQIIKRDRATGVLSAGSDGRADGCAMGF